MLAALIRFKMGVWPCSLHTRVSKTLLHQRTLRTESRLSFGLWCFMIELRAWLIIKRTRAVLEKCMY